MTLVAADKAVAEEIEAIGLVEKIILYQWWMLEFVNNFVSFSRLYDPQDRALFEQGTLVMDGRRFTLCVAVANRAAHVRIAQNSKLFILYVALTQGKLSDKTEVAVGVTSGGKGNLYVGKHGIFIDRDGRPWDAQVTQIIENPISFREALISPFRRMGALVQSQIEKFSGAGEKLVAGKLTQQTAIMAASMQTAAQNAQTPTQAAASAPQPQRGRNMRDLVIGGSVAFAALGGTLAYISKTLNEIENPIGMVVKIVGLLALAMLLPMTINAWIKLRQRDIGTLLEAGGWAINSRMRLTRLMQRIFTRRPKLPPHARKQRFDLLKLYADSRVGPIKWVCRWIGEVWKNLKAAS